MAKEFQPLAAILSVLQQPSSLVFKPMEKETMALQTALSQAAAPPAKNEPDHHLRHQTAAWSPFSDGIINVSSTSLVPAKKSDEEILKKVDQHINVVLYGAGRGRRRLPVFEEISPSFDIDELMKIQIEIFQYAFASNN